MVRSKIVDFFLLQKWIDLDELNPMVWVPSIVRRRIDFSLAVFKLRALRAVHPYQRRPPKEATSRTRLLAHRHHTATMGGALRPEVAVMRTVGGAQSRLL